MLSDFKKFVMRGNVVDMAVGVVMGVAFSAIVNSLVDDIIMPPVGLVLGGADFTDLFLLLGKGAVPGPYASLAAAQEAGAVTLNYGLFINALLNFAIIAGAMFMLISSIKWVSHEAEPPATEEPTTKACPYCLSTIPLAATRCPDCTSELPEPTP
jgi:large conductance mechanosensitive channel